MSEEDKKWLQELRDKSYDWCDDDQWACCKMIFDLIGGEHHLCGKVKEWGRGICYNTRHNNLATFDFSLLTNMVLMAHDRIIRVEIVPSGPGMLKWCLWKRKNRDGKHYEKHPTIETAIEYYTKFYNN